MGAAGVREDDETKEGVERSHLEGLRLLGQLPICLDRLLWRKEVEGFRFDYTSIARFGKAVCACVVAPWERECLANCMDAQSAS